MSAPIGIRARQSGRLVVPFAGLPEGPVEPVTAWQSARRSERCGREQCWSSEPATLRRARAHASGQRADGIPALGEAASHRAASRQRVREACEALRCRRSRSWAVGQRTPHGSSPTHGGRSWKPRGDRALARHAPRRRIALVEQAMPALLEAPLHDLVAGEDLIAELDHSCDRLVVASCLKQCLGDQGDRLGEVQPEAALPPPRRANSATW
jgi:hypothetical protein